MNIRAKRTELVATDIHAEHVGSLLRQPWLLTARADYKAGQITEGELRAAEDRAADANIVNGIKAANPDVTVGMHICRGNNRSAYMAKGGYEPVAEQLFGTVPVDRFLLEYDDERSGGFEPLRFVRPGAVVVLGLVSSKTPVLESQDTLRRRIDEAARYVPLENLALSPQCGFASTSAGNVLTQDEQKAKLALVAARSNLAPPSMRAGLALARCQARSR
jgi:methionine synthase II (cobalamin-independent)